MQPKRYIVKPTKSIIQPQDSVTVQIQLLPLANQDEVEQFLKTKQKFMIQSIRAYADLMPEKASIHSIVSAVFFYKCYVTSVTNYIL